MTEANDISNLERLHELATRPADEVPDAVRVRENYDGTNQYIDFGNGLEVVREAGTTVLRGVLGDVKVGDLGEGAVITVSFEAGSTEPSTFLRWDKLRSDNGEGRSIPKTQRNRIAGHLIERFAA